MDDSTVMPFGKYRGEKLANVPASYLLWLYDQNSTSIDGRKVCHYVRENLDVLKAEIERNKK